MATHEESDFELAQRLHRELNEAERDVILLSDTEDDVKPVELKKVKEEVCFDNQQAITVSFLYISIILQVNEHFPS